MKTFANIVMAIGLMVLMVINVTTISYGQTTWEKYAGNPVLDKGSPGSWDADYIESPSVIFDGNIYHMWYDGGVGMGNTSTCHVGYATSPDGINWQKYLGNPVLSGDAGSWDAVIFAPHVIFDGTTFHMWFSGSATTFYGVEQKIGYATSTDGIHWLKSAHNPVLVPSQSWEGRRVLGPRVIIKDSTFHMWYAGLSDGFKTGYATSLDGVNWTKYDNNPVLERNEGVARENGVQPAAVIVRDSLFNMWYSSDYADKWCIGYAESVDGINWQRYEQNPVLDKGKSGTWDSYGVAWPAVLFDGSAYKMWYTGMIIYTSYGYERIGYATSLPALTHDMMISSTPLPVLCAPSHANYRPHIKIKNRGSTDEFNIAVTCRIDSADINRYSDTIIVDGIDSGQEQEVLFQAMKPADSTMFDIMFYTRLQNDEYVLNDTLKAKLAISNLIDGFENQLGNWCSNGEWGITSEFFNSGRSSLNNSPYMNYMYNANCWLEFNSSFDFSSLRTAHISYWTKYYILENYDYGYFEVSVDSGGTWRQVGEAYTGMKYDWVQDTRSLEEFCGGQFTDVRIRYLFVSDSTQKWTYKGWFLDDIKISFEPQTTVEGTENQISREYVLFENYPNPFNPTTTVLFQLAKDSYVELSIYNALGQLIRTLISGKYTAGSHDIEWNGRDQFGEEVVSGIYFYKFKANDFSKTKKMMLIR